MTSEIVQVHLQQPTQSVNGFVCSGITAAYDGDIFSIVESEDSCTDDNVDDLSVYATSSDLED